MYHQHSQQQGQQPFSNGPRPPHQPPQNQHQNHPNMQPMGFQFPRPTQLPDELESALAIRGGARDMDHRQIDHTNQHQNQGSSSGISQHGGYGSNPMSLSTDNQSGHLQGVNWSSYQAPAKLFASPLPNVGHQSQHHISQAEARVPNWTAPANDSPSTEARRSNSGGVGQNLYTPESAGSILASFGLSNEDLEVLSHYPDDQLTPDTLPFILRDIQINKTGNQKSGDSTSSSSFSRHIHDAVLPRASRSNSPKVPSLLTITQTAGKVIDYGHASRAKDDGDARETFKREPLSNERTVKMYPASSSSAEKTERRQVRLDPTEPSKHGDRDYRRTSSDQRRSSRSPRREFPTLPKSRNLDKDYRHDGLKPRPSSESRSEASSSGSKPHSGSKKLPTPTMISDFSAVSPKVYPHTCSLCNIQCDQEKDWFDHVNTVNHTAACREMRSRYPSWKPNVPSRSERYGSRALWDAKDDSPSRSTPPSRSRSPSPSFSHSKHRGALHPHRLQTRNYSPHRQPRHYNYTERRHRFQHHAPTHSGSHSPPHSHRTSSSYREPWVERRDRAAGVRRSGLKRPRDYSASPSPPAGRGSKHGGSANPVTKGPKAAAKPSDTKTTKASAKPPPAKKKKKVVAPAALDVSVAQRLVYLSGIPNEASEQEVTDMVRLFGKINNVILMPSSEEESDAGQKASVCMMNAEDAKALATSTSLLIREQPITATVAKVKDIRAEKQEAGQPASNSSKLVPGQETPAAESDCAGDQKTSGEKCQLLITGLPKSGWSESDIISLLQPYEPPSEIIQATQIGKALVSLSAVEVAEEIVKAHSDVPAKIKDSEVKMVLLKQPISFSTPVALYNLLMGSEDSLESPVGWGSLLVIRNVPDTTSGSPELQKLVQRFGTVINTLVLNNMVICEMATTTMAWSVFKRFQTFPCIIQSNPLFFSRKSDPRANTDTKVIAAPQASPQDKPANGKDTKKADEQEGTHKEDSAAPLEEVEKGSDETVNLTEKTEEDEALEGKGGEDTSVRNVETTVCQSSAAVEAELVSSEASAAQTEDIKEEDKRACAAPAGDDQTPTEEEKAPKSFEDVPPLPKMTQAMVNALLEECRTRTANQPSNTAAPPSGEQLHAPVETQQGTSAGEQTSELAKSPAEEIEEEDGVKKQDKDSKFKDARKERESSEGEKRKRNAWAKESSNRRREQAEKYRKERERKEERKEWERKGRERRERKRSHGESLSGSRSSFRSEGHRPSSQREEHCNLEAEAKMDEEGDEFPFNMSDFVTLDEVGDVADIPSAPPSSVPMETCEVEEDSPTSVHREPPEDASLEASASQLKHDQNTCDSLHASATAAEASDQLMLPDQTASLVLSAAAEAVEVTALEVTAVEATAVEAAAVEVTAVEVTAVEVTAAGRSPPESPLVHLTPEADATPHTDSTSEPEPLLEPTNSSNIPETTAETQEAEKDDSVQNHSQAKEEEEEEDGAMMSNKLEEKEKQSEDNETNNGAAAEEKQENSEDNVSNPEEESGKTNLKTEATKTTRSSLPPFDASSPVGMEFLVPKTGFFCKVCKRFFSGAKEAEINHCKTLKHYENLQTHLKTMQPAT